MRMHLWLALVVVMALALGRPLQAQEKIRFDIAPQALSQALFVFSEQAHITVLSAAEELKGKVSPGVRGELMPDEAVRVLLGDSGVSYSFKDAGTLLVGRRGMGRQAGNAESAPELRVAQAGHAAADAPAAATPNQATEHQGESDKLAEIVVTAQKRIERLQDVPMPITVMSGQSLASANKLRVEDYYNKVPGLSLGVSGNGSEPVLAIRGITTGGDTNPTVGIVVDEVSYGSSVGTGAQTPAVVDIDPGDLARVEVLRGPQGTLYGASSIGGLLKFVTVDPSTDRLSGNLQAGSTTFSHSNDYGYSIRGSVNVPVNDTFAVRVSGFTLRDPGYVDNVETGQRDVNSRDSKGGRLSALWRPTDAWSLKLSALIQRSERSGTEDVDTALGGNFEQAFLSGTGLYRREAQAYSATLVGKLGAAELTSATGYSIDKLTDSVDLTTYLPNAQGEGAFAVGAQSHFGVDRAASFIHNDVKKFTQEIRVALPLGKSVNWLAGVFYTKEDTSRDNGTFAADATGAISGLLLATTYNPSKFEEYAAFTNLTVNITDRWDVQFGGRLSHNKQAYPTVLSGPMVLDFGLPTDPFTLFASNEIKDTAFTYLVTPRFKVSEDLMVYLRAASGYRPGGLNNACGFPGVPCKFKADTTQNYDLGIKGRVAGLPLTFDGALYYIDWKDIQIPGIVAGFSTYTGNVSRAKSQGVEFSVEAKPLRGLVLSAWTAYNDAQLRETFPSGSLAGNPGDRLPYSSRFSGNISVDQDFPMSGTVTGFVGGTLSYVGDRKGNFQAASVVRMTYPAYTQLDVRTGVRYDTWTFNVFANNLTDRRGVLRGGLDAVFIPSYFTYIPPRMIGLAFAKSY